MKMSKLQMPYFVFFPKGLTHGLSLKIEIWPLFVFLF